MWQYVAKVLLTAALVVAISELGKRSSFWGALLASLPLTSLLAFVWLYLGTGNPQSVAGLSQSIFWLVLASLPLFVALSLLLRSGVSFWVSVSVACLVTVGAYVGLVWLLKRFGIQL